MRFTNRWGSTTKKARSYILAEVAVRIAYMNFLLETSLSFLGKMPHSRVTR